MSSNAKPQPRLWLRTMVAGNSMQPTLQPKDMLLLRRTRRFKPGQVVLFEDQAFRLQIKRLDHALGDAWWVLGDNQAASTDSRTYGPINAEQIIAVAVARYWPRPKRIKSRL